MGDMLDERLRALKEIVDALEQFKHFNGSDVVIDMRWETIQKLAHIVVEQERRLAWLELKAGALYTFAAPADVPPDAGDGDGR